MTWLSFILGACLLLGACAPAEPRVRGALLEVQGSSIQLPDAIRLRDNGGREWTFGVDPAILTDSVHRTNAAHLRQHLAYGEQVTMFYRDSASGPIAYRIVDE